MPSGKFHRDRWSDVRTWVLVFVVILLVLSVSFGFYLLLLAFGIFFGYELGAYVEPDLDHRNMTYSEYAVMRKFGCLGALWVGFWTPYSYLVPHRSFLSHSVPVGTLVRFLYLFSIPAILVVWAGNLELLQDARILVFLLGVFLGMMVSDFIHVWFDWLKGNE